MKLIVFVCHGNICRSPVAEILFNKKIKEQKLDDKYLGVSKALSTEEIGNDIYPPMQRVLFSHGVKFDRHRASQISKDEFEKAEYIFYMDQMNLHYLNRMFGPSQKYLPLRIYLDCKDIEDSWYTDRHEYVYQQINEAVDSVIQELIKKDSR